MKVAAIDIVKKLFHLVLRNALMWVDVLDSSWLVEHQTLSGCCTWLPLKRNSKLNHHASHKHLIHFNKHYSNLLLINLLSVLFYLPFNMSSIVNKIANAFSHHQTDPVNNSTAGNTNHDGQDLNQSNASHDSVDGHPVGKKAAALVKEAEGRKNLTNLNNTSGYNNSSQPFLPNAGGEGESSGVKSAGASAVLGSLLLGSNNNSSTSGRVASNLAGSTGGIGSGQPAHTGSAGAVPDEAAAKGAALMQKPHEKPMVDRSTRPGVGSQGLNQAPVLEHSMKKNILVTATEFPEVHTQPINMPHVSMKPSDTSLPAQHLPQAHFPKLQAIKVNSTFASNLSPRAPQSPSAAKISELLSKLNNTAIEVDDLAKQKQDEVSRSATEAIAKVLSATESNQKALIDDVNKRSDEVDQVYRQQLQLYVSGLDKIRANGLAELEKEFETRQKELLHQAKRNIDQINMDANKSKLQILQDAQTQSMQRINNITENVAALALQDAAHRLNSTITTTITTNTKGLMDHAEHNVPQQHTQALNSEKLGPGDRSSISDKELGSSAYQNHNDFSKAHLPTQGVKDSSNFVTEPRNQAINHQPIA
jgi:hypothetical protein